MTGLEFLLAALGNLRILFVLCALGAGVFSVASWCAYFDQLVRSVKCSEKKPSGRTSTLVTCVTFTFGLLACIPNANQLWEVRIALVKIHLASPENVTAGVQRIDEISKKLECKYLGCEKQTSTQGEK